MSAQRERLKAGYYNSREYNAVTNPGGMARNGHRNNFPAACKDIGDAIQEMVDYDDTTRTGIQASNNATIAAVQASNDAIVATVTGLRDQTLTYRNQAGGYATDASGFANNASNSATTATNASADAKKTVAAYFPQRLDATGSWLTDAATGDPGTVANPATAPTNVAGYGYVYEKANAQGQIYTKGVVSASTGLFWEVEVEIEQSVKNAGETPAAQIGLQGLDANYASTGAVVKSALTATTPQGSVTVIKARFASAAQTGVLAWPQPGTSVWLRPFVIFNRKSDDSGPVAASTARVRRIAVRDVTAVVQAETQASIATTAAGTMTYCSQADAEAGVVNVGTMTPLRVAQAIERIRPSGASPAGGTTLTNTSALNQVFNPAAPGDWVKLPAANTYGSAGAKFEIANRGAFDLLVFDAVGALKGFVRPGASINCQLVDYSSPAGTWLLSRAALFGSTAKLAIQGLGGNLAAALRPLQVVSLDADRELVVIASTTGFYGVVYNRNSRTWGAPTLIGAAAASGLFRVLAISATAVLFVQGNNTPGQIAACVLSISGTSITPNTAATANYGSDIWSDFVGLYAVGASYALRAGSSTAWVIGLTVSGTTVTIAGGFNIGVGSSQVSDSCFVAGATLVTFNVDASTEQICCQAFTFPAGVPTAGVATNIATTLGIYIRVSALGTGRWAVVYRAPVNSTRMALIGLSGSTMNVLADISVFGLAFPPSETWPDGLATAVVGADKVLVAIWDGNTVSLNLLRDNGGGISAGTSTRAYVVGGNFSHLLAFSVVGTTVSLRHATTSSVQTFKVDCSGANAVVTPVDYTDTSSALAILGRHSGGTGEMKGALSSALGVLSPANVGTVPTLQTPTGLRRLALDSDAPAPMAIGVTTSQGWNCIWPAGANTPTVLRKMEMAE